VQWRHNIVADIPFKEVTGWEDVQNGGHSIWKNGHGFWLFSSILVGKILFSKCCFLQILVISINFSG
jgi:hypothetical protein